MQLMCQICRRPYPAAVYELLASHQLSRKEKLEVVEFVPSPTSGFVTSQLLLPLLLPLCTSVQWSSSKSINQTTKLERGRTFISQLHQYDWHDPSSSRSTTPLGEGSSSYMQAQPRCKVSSSPQQGCLLSHLDMLSGPRYSPWLRR